MNEKINIVIDASELAEICNCLNQEAIKYDGLIVSRANVVPVQTLEVWSWYAKRLRLLSSRLVDRKREAA
jgi:hypothetical protein